MRMRCERSLDFSTRNAARGTVRCPRKILYKFRNKNGERDHERIQYPGSGEGEVRSGGEAGSRGKVRLLRRRSVIERLRPNYAESLRRGRARELSGGRRFGAAPVPAS